MKLEKFINLLYSEYKKRSIKLFLLQRPTDNDINGMLVKAFSEKMARNIAFDYFSYFDLVSANDFLNRNVTTCTVIDINQNSGIVKILY